MRVGLRSAGAHGARGQAARHARTRASCRSRCGEAAGPGGDSTGPSVSPGSEEATPGRGGVGCLCLQVWCTGARTGSRVAVLESWRPGALGPQGSAETSYSKPSSSVTLSTLRSSCLWILIPSCPVPSRPVRSSPVLSRPIPSHPISSHPVQRASRVTIFPSLHPNQVIKEVCFPESICLDKRAQFVAVILGSVCKCEFPLFLSFFFLLGGWGRRKRL